MMQIWLPTWMMILMVCSALWCLSAPVSAQLTDITQTPNPLNAGIQKSLEQQVGADPNGGDINTPDTSRFIIARDPFRAIRRGRQLFQRKFTVAQGFGPRISDGIGDIATINALGHGLMDSCAGCHANPRGSAGSGGAIIFTRPDHRKSPHLFGVGLKEMLADEITDDLRTIQANAISQAQSQGHAVTLPLQSKGINYGSITAFPNGPVDTSQVQGVNPDLRVRPFFADGRRFSLRELTVVAVRDTMGLQAQDRVTTMAADGATVMTPSGLVLDGSMDAIVGPPPADPADPRRITESLVDFFEFYLLHYFKPGTYEQTQTTSAGLRVMKDIGCTTCHIQNLQIDNDRRVADVETVYDRTRGIFNNLFATATGFFTTITDNPALPPRKAPQLGSFLVRNIFTDLKRHDLGPRFHERNFNGTITTQFMTLPLWGVGNTPPYGHDGRSINLREVIERHGGEAQAQRDAFINLDENKRDALLKFLDSLIIFPPDDTASNLDAGNPNAPEFPQNGHGSIALSVLFNNPSDPE
jgi:hypothetical protein